MGEALASRFALLQKGRGQREDKQEHVKYIATLTVVFVVLVGSALLLLVADTTQRQLLQQSFTYYSASEAKEIHGNDLSGSPGSSSKLSAAANTRPDVAVLDNDLNNNGNPDGIVDPLVVVGILAPLAASNNSRVAVSVLDNDLDNDGNLDSISDPLVVLAIVLYLVALVDGRPLLTLREPLELSSICSPLLKPPG